MHQGLRSGMGPLLLLAAALGASGCSTTSKPDELHSPALDIGLRAPGDVAAVPSTTVAGTRPAEPEAIRAALDAQGAALYGDGAFAEAGERFQRITDTNERSWRTEEAIFWTADSYFRAGLHEKAYGFYEKLLKHYPGTDYYDQDLEKIFQIGKLFVEEKARRPSWFFGLDHTDRDFGIEVLERFEKQHDRHPLAPEAIFLVGEAHLQANDPELAIESWQRLVKEYPASKWATGAEYRICLAFLALSYGVEYDKRPLLTALRRLRTYVKKYPTGDNVQDAELKVTQLEDNLAGHDLGIAKRYARDDHFVSAQIYLTSIRRDYPKTRAAEEATRLSKLWPDPPLPQPPTEEEKK